MSDYKKVDGHPGLIKNEDGIVLNTNESEIEQARARKRARREAQKEIDDLKQDVSELKDMMRQLIEKL